MPEGAGCQGHVVHVVRVVHVVCVVRVGQPAEV
jgi:hypothetical protein